MTLIVWAVFCSLPLSDSFSRTYRPRTELVHTGQAATVSPLPALRRHAGMSVHSCIFQGENRL
uniref:Uncharacterized protein n=1 Tax=Anguilla anguilla TaxID=7936 RepID=A0A0E9VHJ2_ANGAN